MGYEFAHWELDCSRYLDRNEVRAVVQAIQNEDYFAVFWDEFHHLRVRDAQSLLLKPSEDVRGIWIIAMTDDHYRELQGPLFERYRKIWLTTPTNKEMVEFFLGKAAVWNVGLSLEIAETMVKKTQRSFRTCLDLLAAGAENDDRILDRATLEEFLCLDQPTEDSTLYY